MTRRVLVVGLRATGEAVVSHCARGGDIVTVVEEDPGRPAYDARAATVRALGATLVERPNAEAWDELVAASDLVVPSPGVRPDHPVYIAALRYGVPVRGDVDLALELAQVPVIAVTGTNGKTTVTTLVARMLAASGIRALVAGNIGDAALGLLDEPADVLVLEVSSFQLHATTRAFRPRVAVLCNIAEDHLDWHGSFHEYAAAKARVFAHQEDGDVLVANVDDPVVARLAERAPARRVGFAARAASGVAGARGGELVAADGTVLIALSDLPRVSPHDVLNAAAAATAALEMGATPTGVRTALREAPRLHHRTELVGKAGAVEYVDDSKATNPHATLAALEGYARGTGRVVLLAGGVSKGVDLGALRAAGPAIRAVVAIGATPEAVEAAFAGTAATVRAGSMREAVGLAAGLAQPGDTVLLSPACASFDWYGGYEERGEDFSREVRTLAGEASSEHEVLQ